MRVDPDTGARHFAPGELAPPDLIERCAGCAGMTPKELLLYVQQKTDADAILDPEIWLAQYRDIRAALKET